MLNNNSSLSEIITYIFTINNEYLDANLINRCNLIVKIKFFHTQADGKMVLKLLPRFTLHFNFAALDKRNVGDRTPKNVITAIRKT